MFCKFLDRSDLILFRDSIFDNLIDCMRIGDIVNSSDIIALFEYEVTVVQYICQESMSFHIDLQDTLHIHEFYIIDEEDTRMNEYDRLFSDKHGPTEIVDKIQYELEKDIVDCDYEYRKEDIITKIMRKVSSVKIGYPYEYSEGYQKKEEFGRLEK